jgi:AAA+ ATPase superfamily predicted ATPase
MDSKIIGRKYEQQRLKEALESPNAELIAIYGRRRVGKTYLVRTFFQSEICFDLSGSLNASTEDQLNNFSKQLGSYMATGIRPATPANWREAFEMLEIYITTLQTKGKKVIFFDEMPWLDTMHSGFLGAFDYFWNNWCTKRNDILTIVCGSAASWMIKKIVHTKGGLHNRITHKMRLLPFSLSETKEFFLKKSISLDDYQIAQLYMVMGGVPHYLNAVQRGKSAVQNIDETCFSENGLLRNEFKVLYSSLFKNAERHIAVIRALAGKRAGLTRNEIVEATKFSSGGYLTGVLDELKESGFIGAHRLPNRKAKDMVYRLEDEYSLFYISFIEPNPTAQAGAWAILSNGARWKAWSGFAFESMCFKHIQKIKDALNIGAIYSEQFAWYDRNAGVQIDLLIHRADNCINMCEMKFAQNPFEISADYAKELQKKLIAYRTATSTQKTIFTTMVTTYGIKKNKWSEPYVDAEITLDQLF